MKNNIPHEQTYIGSREFVYMDKYLGLFARQRRIKFKVEGQRDEGEFIYHLLVLILSKIK